MDEQNRTREIQQHLEAIRRLEAEAAAQQGPAGRGWPPDGYYLVWHVVIGMMLGMIGGAVSLAVNVVGAPLAGQHPLQLIRVYLTFPMGEQALYTTDGVALFVGCVLYLTTGALHGVVFHLVMSLWFAKKGAGLRFIVATVMGLLLWVTSFYGVLIWLQPVLQGGNWIASHEYLPWWVAASTHLVFAWTMLLIEFWGRFEPYQQRLHTNTAGVLLAVTLAGACLALGGCDDSASAQATDDDPFAEADQPPTVPPTAPAPPPADAAATPPAEPAGPPSPTDPKPIEYPTWETQNPGDYLGYNQRASLIQRGKMVYDKYCVGCHGVHGDGNGPAAARLITQPRDFTSGIYKFRSTDSGSLPLDEDLYRTITRGLSRVSMPAFPLMPERDKVAVIQYIKSFYPQWHDELPQRTIVPVPLPPDDLMTEDRIRRGHVVYLAMQCSKCHGYDGAGRGATQTQYTDAWGDPQKPFNFTRGSLKGGDGPRDIYRTFHTGLRSIMPAYDTTTLASVNQETVAQEADTLDEQTRRTLQPYIEQFPPTAGAVFGEMSPQQRQELGVRNSWDLVAYVLSLRQPISTRQAVLGEEK